MEEFKFIVTVDAGTFEQAQLVMRERIYNEEDYGFPYLIDWVQLGGVMGVIVFDNIDQDLLNLQRLELINLIWDNSESSLWGLVNMLDDWYDRTYPIKEAS